MLRLRKLVICLSVIVTFAAAAQGQNLPKVRAAYTSIGIQFDPVYIMTRKEAIVAAALRAASLKGIRKHNACNVRPLPRSRQADCVR